MSTDPTPIPADLLPDDVYLSIAAEVNPPDAAALAGWWSFRRTVDAAWAAGRTADDEIREQAYLSVLDGSAIVVRAEVERQVRTAAAADIRAEIVDEPTHENLRMMNAAFALAARVAENGADHV